MAIGYGVACPKGKTRKQLKARKDREDAKQLKAFRDAVWLREELKALGYSPTYPVPDDYTAMSGRCQHCGRMVGRYLEFEMTGEVHHRISRRHKATRYNPDNGVLLCNHLVNNCHAKAENGDITV